MVNTHLPTSPLVLSPVLSHGARMRTTLMTRATGRRGASGTQQHRLVLVDLCNKQRRLRCSGNQPAQPLRLDRPPFRGHVLS